MTERVATTPGLFPLPDPAKEQLSDLKGHQKGDLISGTEGGEIAAAYEEYRGEVVADPEEEHIVVVFGADDFEGGAGAFVIEEFTDIGDHVDT